jgi:hypothetical protein
MRVKKVVGRGFTRQDGSAAPQFLGEQVGLEWKDRAIPPGAVNVIVVEVVRFFELRGDNPGVLAQRRVQRSGAAFHAAQNDEIGQGAGKRRGLAQPLAILLPSWRQICGKHERTLPGASASSPSTQVGVYQNAAMHVKLGWPVPLDLDPGNRHGL